MNQRNIDKVTGRHPTALSSSLLHFVHQDVLKLLALRETYLQLFSREADVEVLNSTAPTTFGLIQEAIREAAILSIARLLMDPAEDRRGFENLCLENLVINTPGDTSDVLERLNQLRDEYDPVRLMRNKVHGHRDARTIHAIASNEGSLLGVKTTDLWEAVDGVVEIAEEIYARIPFMNFTFADFSGPDGNELIASLRDSNTARRT